MKPISQLGYEEARDELVEVVRTLEQGGLDLDASLKLWERGEELAKRCEEHLAGAANEWRTRSARTRLTRSDRAIGRPRLSRRGGLELEHVSFMLWAWVTHH